MTPDAWKPWIVLGAAFGIAGMIGGGLLGLAAEALFPNPSWELAFLPVTGLLVVCFALPLWRFVLDEGRSGVAWGAVIAATIPVFLTLLFAAVMYTSKTDSISETMYAAALLQLLQLPLTLVLAVTGALVETTESTLPRCD